MLVLGDNTLLTSRVLNFQRLSGVHANEALYSGAAREHSAAALICD